jgi:hypothetical protein
MNELKFHNANLPLRERYSYRRLCGENLSNIYLDKEIRSRKHTTPVPIREQAEAKPQLAFGIMARKSGMKMGIWPDDTQKDRNSGLFRSVPTVQDSFSVRPRERHLAMDAMPDIAVVRVVFRR